MFTKSFENDLKVWIEVAKSSLHCGNAVGAARLHALQMMIDLRLGWVGMMHEQKHRPMMETCSRLCEFAKENGTAAETNIFIHIIIDLMTTELNNLPKEPPARLSQVTQSHFDHLDEMYPDGKDFDDDTPLDVGWDIPL